METDFSSPLGGEGWERGIFGDNPPPIKKAVHTKDPFFGSPAIQLCAGPVAFCPLLTGSLALSGLLFLIKWYHKSIRCQTGFVLVAGRASVTGYYMSLRAQPHRARQSQSIPTRWLHSVRNDIIFLIFSIIQPLFISNSARMNAGATGTAEI